VIFVFTLLPFGILDSSLLEKFQQLFFMFEICYIVIFSAIQCGERLGANCKEDYLIINNARDETRDSGQQQLQDIWKFFQKKCGRYIFAEKGRKRRARIKKWQWHENNDSLLLFCVSPSRSSVLPTHVMANGEIFISRYM